MNKSVVDVCRRASHKQRLTRSFPGDIKPPAWQFYAYLFGQQTLLNADRNRRTGPAAAGLSFPRTAFIDA